MQELHLCESEYRFLCVIWEHEPLRSHELVTRCAEQLSWKKSTTYTMLKKLCDRICPAVTEDGVAKEFKTLGLI